LEARPFGLLLAEILPANGFAATSLLCKEATPLMLLVLAEIRGDLRGVVAAAAFFVWLAAPSASVFVLVTQANQLNISSDAQRFAVFCFSVSSAFCVSIGTIVLVKQVN